MTESVHPALPLFRGPPQDSCSLAPSLRSLLATSSETLAAKDAATDAGRPAPAGRAERRAAASRAADAGRAAAAAAAKPRRA